MGEEKTYNPFLRVTEKAIIAAVGLKAEDYPINILRQQVLQELRAQKDKYKYRLWDEAWYKITVSKVSVNQASYS